MWAIPKEEAVLFNSVNFAFFLPIVFVFYWYFTKGNFKVQNFVLLVSSYFFYSCWDWRFLFLLIFSTSLDYFTGLKIEASIPDIRRKIWLWISIFVNIGLLGVFKYFNFFSQSFVALLSSFGFEVNSYSINVILPVGISFYTFHGLSYVLDIYNKKIKAETNIINYSVFVSFFPLLVAGPIERATHLLPQIKRARVFNRLNAVNGMRQILWGLFKKVVIADNCAVYANQIFDNSSELSGSTLLIGAFFFAVQIYGDFSGYSDIALGVARLFGIELLQNFSFPYFSRSIAEFWRRWHISLSSWFRDYLYIPLGGSNVGVLLKIRNIFIVFLISGFWHGASWTFIFWGLLNALFIMPSIVRGSNREYLEIVAKGKLLPTISEVVSILLTFVLTLFAWIFFRSETLDVAFSYVSRILSFSLFETPKFIGMVNAIILVFMILFFFIIEWCGRQKRFALEDLHEHFQLVPRWLFYLVIVFVIGIYMQTSEQEFIYFQF